MGVAVARDVEPVARLVFPVTGRLQQPVNEPFVGIRLGIGQKRIHLAGVGGSPVRSNVTRRMSVALSASLAGRNSFLVQSRENKGVDGIARPALVLYGRYGRAFRLDE